MPVSARTVDFLALAPALWRGIGRLVGFFLCLADLANILQERVISCRPVSRVRSYIRGDVGGIVHTFAQTRLVMGDRIHQLR